MQWIWNHACSFLSLVSHALQPKHLLSVCIFNNKVLIKFLYTLSYLLYTKLYYFITWRCVVIPRYLLNRNNEQTDNIPFLLNTLKVYISICLCVLILWRSCSRCFKNKTSSTTYVRITTMFRWINIYITYRSGDMFALSHCSPIDIW